MLLLPPLQQLGQLCLEDDVAVVAAAADPAVVAMGTAAAACLDEGRWQARLQGRDAWMKMVHGSLMT